MKGNNGMKCCYEMGVKSWKELKWNVKTCHDMKCQSSAWSVTKWDERNTEMKGLNEMEKNKQTLKWTDTAWNHDLRKG